MPERATTRALVGLLRLQLLSELVRRVVSGSISFSIPIRLKNSPLLSPNCRHLLFLGNLNDHVNACMLACVKLSVTLDFMLPTQAVICISCGVSGNVSLSDSVNHRQRRNPAPSPVLTLAL